MCVWCQWPSVLVNLALEQEKILPLLLDLIESSSEVKLRPLTGVLRNLARHTTNKEHFGETRVHSSLSECCHLTPQKQCLVRQVHGAAVNYEAGNKTCFSHFELTVNDVTEPSD